MNIPPLFKHQEETIKFLATKNHAFISSDAGTGKSRCILEHVRNNRHKGRTLYFGPKSILKPSIAEDIKKFTPDLTYAIALAPDRASAFAMNTDIVLTNIDAVTWVAKNPTLLDGFHLLIIDESTSVKNNTSQRSKAMTQIADRFSGRILMTGTPTPQSILDLWSQMRILDGGQRLGKSYWAFRSATHTPVSKGAFTEWKEKEGIQDAVYGLISDINIRYELEKCLDMPENVVNEISFDLSPKHYQLYAKLKREAVLTLEKGDVSAINAASLATKLMQAASGCVYSIDHEPLLLTTDRYELIMDLAEARDQCLIAFQWAHQRDQLIEEAKRRNFSYAVIDGSIPLDKRNQAVEDFQTGNLKLILAHPASAAHGLTLTKGTTTIWASPTYDSEKYVQFNHRIYRAGQTQRTETIHVAANHTIDLNAYARLLCKVDGMKNLLELLSL